MSLPKILFITAPANDFLADSLLHGLRSILGSRVVDYPRCRYMDASLDEATKRTMHGRGFTLYGRRPDAEGDAIDRDRVWERASQGEFDFVVFSSISRQHQHLIDQHRNLACCNLVLIDGEDAPAYYPWTGAILRRGLRNAMRGAVAARGARRYIRERPGAWWQPGLRRRPRSHLLNAATAAMISWTKPGEIGFSIPSDLIVAQVQPKKRLLFEHVVDEDTARLVPGSSTRYLYQTEADYFRALRESRFAITRKREGWECLRHYEIAASGCVPCFRFLSRKPRACPPFGLDASNCICYDDPAELIARLRSMPDREYDELSRGALAWARRNSTVSRASRFLEDLGWTLPYA